MQLRGRTIVTTALAIALAMAGGAWLFHYGSSREAAKFWGAQNARLIVGRGPVELLELRPPGPGKPGRETLAGREIASRRQIGDEPGMVHLRHALTQDGHFLWDARRRESAEVDYDWAYALRFGEGPERLDVLLRRDLDQLGKVGPDGAFIDVLPCPRLAPALDQYLRRDIGVLPGAPEAASSRGE